MHQRKIQNTSAEFTEFGFGASLIGNLCHVTPVDVTPVDDTAAAVDAAWEAGIRYFDTAPHEVLPAEGLKYDYQDASPAVIAGARAIAEVCEAHGATVPAAVIAFPRTHPSIINVTLGMRTPEQVVRNVKLKDQRVPDFLWHDLRAQGLIRSDVLSGHDGGRGARCL